MAGERSEMKKLRPTQELLNTLPAAGFKVQGFGSSVCTGPKFGFEDKVDGHPGLECKAHRSFF